MNYVQQKKTTSTKITTKAHECGFVKNDAFVNVATQTLPTLEMEFAPCFRILIV
jgi:hypothetical protein